MPMAAVFIDGGYLGKVLKDCFGEPRINYARLVEWAIEGCGLFRAYYYDCLPFVSADPTPEERDRCARKKKFLSALRRLDRFTVRLGRLEARGTDEYGEPLFEQKQVDIQLAADAAILLLKNRLDLVVLLTGDSDLIPVVTLAQQEGVITRLVHGPDGCSRAKCHQDLWDVADERWELSAEVVERIGLR